MSAWLRHLLWCSCENVHAVSYSSPENQGRMIYRLKARIQGQAWLIVQLSFIKAVRACQNPITLKLHDGYFYFQLIDFTDNTRKIKHHKMNLEDQR